MFFFLIVTGCYSPVVGLSDRQKIEDLKQFVSNSLLLQIHGRMERFHSLSCFGDVTGTMIFKVLVHA